MSIEPGHLVVQAYFAAMWEATRTLIYEFAQIEHQTLPIDIPAWGDLPPGLQAAIKEKGRTPLDAWDVVVMAACEALHLQSEE